MRLLQIKLRGLGSLPVSNWVMLSNKLTLLRFSDPQIGRQVLKAVQSLNPPYDCLSEKPFSNLPVEEVLANGHHRAIAPEKRTIVIGIFDTPPALVKDLGAITPPLYETDRVEIGRRLDYSRWINFVEIASSSRWSEVSEDVRRLLHDYPDGSDTKAIHRLMAEAVPADRVKGAMAEELTAWLTTLEPRQSEIADYPDILEKVHRAGKFAEARELLARQLPQFLAVNSKDVDHLAEQKSVKSDPLIPPVILIDCFDSAPPERTNEPVPEKIGALAERCQCLCFSDDVHAGWNLPAAQVIDFDALN